MLVELKSKETEKRIETKKARRQPGRGTTEIYRRLYVLVVFSS